MFLSFTLLCSVPTCWAKPFAVQEDLETNYWFHGKVVYAYRVTNTGIGTTAKWSAVKKIEQMPSCRLYCFVTLNQDSRLLSSDYYLLVDALAIFCKEAFAKGRNPSMSSMYGIVCAHPHPHPHAYAHAHTDTDTRESEV